MKITKWDITQELSTEEDIIGYLEVVLEEGDDTDRRIAIKNIIRTMKRRVDERPIAMAV